MHRNYSRREKGGVYCGRQIWARLCILPARRDRPIRLARSSENRRRKLWIADWRVFDGCFHADHERKRNEEITFGQIHDWWRGVGCGGAGGERGQRENRGDAACGNFVMVEVAGLICGIVFGGFHASSGR